MSLFDDEIKEVEHNGVRYILRRNIARAKELARNRQEKKSKIEDLCKKKNEYMLQHQRSKSDTAIREVRAKIKRYKLDSWFRVEQSVTNERELVLIEDLLKLSELSQLDGCYVIKSNLPVEVSKEIIHSRYKDLSNVEHGFRRMKTDWLEIRPWYVRTADSTLGHAFVTMLSYIVVKYLEEAWKGLDITVEEGLKLLDGLSLFEVKIGGELKYYEVPEGSDMMQKLLDAAGVKLPKRVVYKKANVGSRVKLTKRV